MKKTILVLGLIFLSNLMFGQNQIDSLVKIGVKYHDNGRYTEAIETYKKALEIDSNSAIANYEIGSTYMYIKDYEKSLKYTNRVIALNDKYLLGAFITKGSCLDIMERTEESIKVFQEGIKKFGNHYLLCYNLGFNYYNLKDYEKVEEPLIDAINNNLHHSSSHLLLGTVMSELNNSVQSLLCLHHFLLLEPNSARAKGAYDLLQTQFKGNVETDKNKPNHTTIYFNSDANKEFSAAELMISMLGASKSSKKNRKKTDDELFIENTTSFFKILGELKKAKNKGLWWDFYVPFFYEIAKSEHIEAYCYYISQSSNQNAQKWLSNNEKKTDNFFKWLKDK